MGQILKILDVLWVSGLSMMPGPKGLTECGGFEVPKIFVAFTSRNFKSENHTRFNKLLVWL
jgi:hypothetical protein